MNKAACPCWLDLLLCAEGADLSHQLARGLWVRHQPDVRLGHTGLSIYSGVSAVYLSLTFFTWSTTEENTLKSAYILCMRTNSEKYTFFVLLQPPKWLYRILLFGYVRMTENKTSGPVGLMEAVIITSHVPSYICMCVYIYIYI